MLKNYFKIAFRSLSKQKVYALLNIAGLTIGITSSLLIFLFIHDELSYDRNHKNADHIYRLSGAYHLPNDGGMEQYATSGAVVGEMIVKDYPEVNQMVRLARMHNKVIEKPVTEEKLYETIVAADSNIFDMFTFPFLAGDPETALLEPYTLVLTQQAAFKYFGKTNVLGETLLLPEDSTAFKVTGIIQDYPSNTHLKLDVITSFETLRSMHTDLTSWWSYGFYTYLELFPNTDYKKLEDKIKFISRNYIADQEDGSGYRQEYALQKLSSIHLESNLRAEYEPNSRKSYVYIFGVVGVFILVIACINFMNLSTARSARRAKEIGIRKVSGAHRTQLISQFMSESILMTLLGALFSMILTLVFLPYFNNITGKSISIEVIHEPYIWTTMLAIIVFAGLLAGSYPSLFLSAFKPTETLKGKFISSGKGNILRKVLVVFQFTISIVLISGTFIVYQHLTFLRDINLGFDKNQTIVLPTRSTNNALADYSILREELKELPQIKGASISSRVPGKEMSNNVVRLGWNDDASWSDMRYLTVDYDFITLYNIQVLAGRGFDERFPSDQDEAFILNESAVRRLGGDNPEAMIGKQLRWQNRNGYVIGVVKDFHFMAANVAVEPFIMVMNPVWGAQYLSVKLSETDAVKGMNLIKEKFASVLPNKVFEYFFLDEDFDQQYKSEDRFMKVFTFFAIIAIVVACLGLYGLAMFTAEQKFKEIGIRKVLGASSTGLVYLQIKGFVILVSIAFIISVPLSFFGMNKWLETFPLREQISPMIFIGSGILSILIAWLTVAYQSVKASRANPVDSIANE